MVKKGYCGNDGLSLGWDLSIIFFRLTKLCGLLELRGVEKKGVYNGL